MTIQEAQKQVDNYISQFKAGYWPPLSNLARLIEEIGELSRELNHRHGSKIKKTEERHSNISDELGDILFTLICIANSENIDLEESLNKVIDKYNTRDSERWQKK